MATVSTPGIPDAVEAVPRQPLADVASLRLAEKLSYGAGEIGTSISWIMVGSFLLLYYTDVARLPVTALGTLMLVTRVLDAIFDPVVGVMVDRTKSRLGKARPYLLYGGVPFAVMMAVSFWSPDASPTIKLVYAYVTFTLLGFLFSLVYIPYGAMLPMLTRDPKEKAQVSSFRAMGTSLASILVYGVTLPAVALFGTNVATGYFVVAACFGLLTALLLWLVVRNCRERYSSDDAGTPRGLNASARDMTRNPMWWIAFSYSLILFVKLSLMVSSFIYLAKEVLHNPQIVSIILPLMSVAILLGGGASGPFIAKLGIVRSNLISLVLGIIFLLAAAYFQSNLLIFSVLFLISAFCSGVQGTTAFILCADSVEVHEKSFGYRAEGLLFSSVSFGMKLGLALGGAATAYVLGWAGYSPDHAVPGVERSIAFLFYGGVALALALQAVGILFYTAARRHGDRVGVPSAKGAAT